MSRVDDLGIVFFYVRTDACHNFYNCKKAILTCNTYLNMLLYLVL